MCGIFAYQGADVGGSHLARAAAGAARRGPHGHGYVATDAGGTLTVRHQLGRLTGPLQMPAGAAGVLGHCRLATVGPADNPAGLQPLPVPGGGWLAHNGNVYNPAALAGADTALVSDSHALAVAYGRHRSAGLEPAVALKAVIEQADQVSWAVTVLDVDGHLYGHRYRHPLWQCTAGGGRCWGSQRCCPTARPLPDREIFTSREPL